MEEFQLIERIQKGQSELYGILIDRYSKMCFSLAYRVSGDPDNAQDIVQEGLIAAYQHLGEFKKESKFSTWLYRIILNKALASKKKQHFFEEVEQVASADEVEDHELHIKQESAIKLGLAALSDKERLIIDLYYYQDQSIREIASICSITESNVKVMMHRARKKMSETITEKSVNLY